MCTRPVAGHPVGAWQAVAMATLCFPLHPLPKRPRAHSRLELGGPGLCARAAGAPELPR